MDVFTTTILTIGGAVSSLITKEAVIQGITGNRADALFCKYMRQIVDRVKGGGEKTNHDLLRAIRKAQLESTVGMCGVILKENGYSSEDILQFVWKKVKNTITPKDSEQIWITELSNNLLIELREISNRKYDPPSSQVEAEIELLLRPSGGNAAQRLAQLKEHLLETTF